MTMPKVASDTLDPKSARISHEWKYESPLIVCRFDPSGRFVFSSAHDRRVQRWRLDDGKLTLLEAHESWVWAIGFSPDGEVAYTGGGDGRLIWWPTAADAPTPLRSIDAHAGWVRCLAVSPDGRLIATGGNDRLVKIWNASDGALLHTINAYESPIYSLLFPDNGFLIAGDLRGKVHQWDVPRGDIGRSFDASALHTFNGGEQGTSFGGVRSLALSPDGQFLACAGLFNQISPMGSVFDPLVLRFEWESQKLLQSHIAADLKGSLWRVEFHPDGSLVGVCGGVRAKHVLFWRSDQDKDAHRFELPSAARDFDLAPDGRRFATSHPDQHLRISTLAPLKASASEEATVSG